MQQGNAGFTENIADYIVGSASQQTPDHLYEHAALAFLDTMAVSLYAQQEPLVVTLRRQAGRLGGNAQATLWGTKDKTNVCQAALVNGAMAHALDYDDNLGAFVGHPSVCLMPAVLALGEHHKLSGAEVLDAYLLGLEIGAWIAKSSGVEFYIKGLHGTPVIGRQAATASAARLLGLDKTQTLNALGIAGTMTNGVKQSFGTMCKPLHAGMAAEGGVQAALLGQDGFESAHDIYEGQFGVFASHHGLNEPVGPEFLQDAHPVERLEVKFHAACFCVHGAINVTEALVSQAAASVDAIERIDVAISQVSMDNAGKTDIETGLDGKFSTAYSVANALVTGETGPQGYTDEAVRNPSVLELMTRTNVHVNPEYNETAVLKTGVEIRLKGGEVLTGEGDPQEDIPSLAEKRIKVGAKFDELCAPLLGDQRAADLKAAILNLKDASDVSDMLSFCAEG